MQRKMNAAAKMKDSHQKKEVGALIFACSKGIFIKLCKQSNRVLADRTDMQQSNLMQLLLV